MDDLTLNDHLDILGHALSTEACIIRSQESYNNIYQQYTNNSSGGPIYVQNYGWWEQSLEFCGEVQLQAGMDQKFSYFSDQQTQVQSHSSQHRRQEQRPLIQSSGQPSSSTHSQQTVLNQEQPLSSTQSQKTISNQEQPLSSTQSQQGNSSVDNESPQILVELSESGQIEGQVINVQLHIQQSVNVTLGTGAQKTTIRILYYNCEEVEQVVKRVVRNFQEKTNNNSLQGYLVKDGTVLQNNRTMDYYNITYNTQLQLVPKLLGGGKTGLDSAAVEVYFLTASSLNPSHNFDYRNVREGANFGNRGGAAYNVPSKWMGIALNVSKYPGSDWLGMSNNPGEWAVVYHGTKQEFTKAIVDGGLQAGKNNAYGKGQLSGSYNAIYCSPFVSEAQGYSSPFLDYKTGQKYLSVFQCRINHTLSEDRFQKHRNDTYWCCGAGCIRPYRLLLKQV